MKEILTPCPHLHRRWRSVLLFLLWSIAPWSHAQTPVFEIEIREHLFFPAELVITDIVMPDKEGLETISDIRRQFPQVKIIAMSGGGHSIDAANPLFIAGKIGASHTLTKPFEIEKILDVVAGMV